MYINKAENEYCNSGYKYRGSDKREKTFCCISVLQTLGTIESCIIYCIFRNTFKVRLF